MADVIKKPLYKFGSKGDEVGKIQTALGDFYKNEGGVVDNDYGRRTRKAVKKWQEAWNADPAHEKDQLVTDGIVGENTYPRLMQWAQAQQQPQPTAPVAEPQPTVTEQPLDTTGDTPGDEGKIDTSDAIGSLAKLLGPSPAEREAQQAKMERNRSQMAMWTGLFDGLRHLGNLYYTAKGARPQQFSDPYKVIDENYQRQKKNLDDMAAYRQAYAKQLYALQHQAAMDKSLADYRKAQADWYKDRGELERLKAIKVIKQKDGRLQKYDPVSGTVEDLTEADPLYQEYVRSQINKNYSSGTGSRRANNGTYGYEKKKWVDENGVWHEERVPTTGERPAPSVPSPKGPKQPTATSKKDKSKGKKKNTQQTSSKAVTNNSGFFNNK